MRTLKLDRTTADELVELLENCDPKLEGTWRYDLSADIRTEFGMMSREERKVNDEFMAKEEDERIADEREKSRREQEAEWRKWTDQEQIKENITKMVGEQFARETYRKEVLKMPTISRCEFCAHWTQCGSAFGVCEKIDYGEATETSITCEGAGNNARIETGRLFGCTCFLKARKYENTQIKS